MAEKFRHLEVEVRIGSAIVNAISESAISTFCRSCDFLLDDNSCEVEGNFGQALSTIKDYCTSAQVGGRMGEMTLDGFIPKGSLLTQNTNS